MAGISRLPGTTAQTEFSNCRCRHPKLCYSLGMTYAYEVRPLIKCPTCKRKFMPKGGKQRCCSRACARKFDWTSRKPKQRIGAPGGYVWYYVENHPNRVRVNKKMRPEGGYIMEHRWIMEQRLGRYLKRREHVHHKNGKRNDNRDSNLELWSLKDPAGIRASDYHCHGCRCKK
jgi:hypothetical protein